MSESPWIVEASRETFQSDVFEKSKATPVIVDFWAPWCAPCRALAPVLEKVITEFDGKCVLVKTNTDELPEAAGLFNVEGIPAVFGVVGGEVIDFFTGAQPEEMVRKFAARLVELAAIRDALALEPRDPAEAENRYREIIAILPPDAMYRDSAPFLGLARVLLTQGKREECHELLAELEARGFLEPEAEQIKAGLDLADMSGADLAAQRAAAEADPSDLQRQFELCEALAGQGQYEEALEIALTLVQQDRHGIGERARQLMVDVFRVQPDSELTTTYRRKLSTALY